jgi:hypothetical protein
MSVWYEIIVTGSENALRGFVAGCEGALGGEEAVIFGHDLDLEASPISQRLKELFAAASRHVVCAPAKLAGEIAGALRARGKEADLDLESIREVVRARLPFSAEAFSQDVAEKIRQTLLAGLPPGVQGEHVEESEEQDPGARGAELYTPEHAYVFRLSGSFVGPLPGIVEMRRRARDLPFVKVKAVELATRPADAPGRS